MNGKTLGIIAIVIILIAGGWYLLKGAPTGTSTTDTTQTPTGMPVETTTTTSTTTTTTALPPKGVTIVYNDQGFSPKSVTVPLGTTITFVDQASSDMWVASAPHPTHQGYDGTTKAQHCVAGYSGARPFDECAAGTSYSFTFLKAGTWGYHNHLSAGDFGTIIVTVPAATVTASTTVKVN